MIARSPYPKEPPAARRTPETIGAARSPSTSEAATHHACARGVAAVSIFALGGEGEALPPGEVSNRRALHCAAFAAVIP